MSYARQLQEIKGVSPCCLCPASLSLEMPRGSQEAGEEALIICDPPVLPIFDLYNDIFCIMKLYVPPPSKEIACDLPT